MRKYSLVCILLLGQLAFGQFDDYEVEAELYETVIEEDGVDDIDRTDFTRGDYLDADVEYKSDYTGAEYNYRELEDEEKEEQNEKPSHQKDTGSTNFGPVIGFIFKAILLLVALAGLYFLYLALSNLRLNKRGEKNRVISAQETENDLAQPEELDDNSLEGLLARAKAEHNYTLAVRYYFLMYLKKLQDHKVITYHHDKTNAEYLTEIADATRSEQFVKMSYVFEYVWYGKKALTAELFATVEQTFVTQIDKVK